MVIKDFYRSNEQFQAHNWSGSSRKTHFMYGNGGIFNDPAN